MSVDAGSVYSAVRIKLDALDKDLQEVRTRFGTLEGTIEKVPAKGQGSFGKFFSFLKTSGVGSFLAVGAAVSGLTRYLGSSIAAATSAQETYSKFGVVFGDIKDRADDTAKAFAKSFDLASVTAKKLLGDTGNLLTGMGATQGQALDLSLQVNTLAADLASFTNIQGGAETAAHALTSAMLGEREQAKSLGIVIRETDVQQRLMEKGQQNLTGEAKLLATAQATLEIATSQSKNAIGDYARTADSAANAQKRAAESSKKLQVAIGTGLNPIATITANLFSTIATKIAEVVEQANKHREALQTKDENRTIEQRILLINEEIKVRQANARTAQFIDDQGRTIKLQLALDEEKKIASLNAERGMLENLSIYKKNSDAASVASTEAAIAAERAKREEMGAYLKLVGEEFEKTEEGKIAAVKKAIATFEAYEKTAVNTLPQVQAILSSLRAELAGLTGETEAAEKAFKNYVDRWDEGDGSIARILTKQEAQAEDAFQKYISGWKESDEAVDKHITKLFELAEMPGAAMIAAVSDLWNQASGSLSAYSSLVENQNALELNAMKKAGASEEEIAKRRNELNEKAFNAHKATSIAEAMINGAVAISKVWAQTGIFGGPIAGSIVAGLTASQVGMITAQQYVPSAATGGIVLPRDGGTLVRTAENKRAELLLNDSPQGAKMIEAFADRIVDAMGSRAINATSAPVYMDGKAVAQIVTRYQDNNLAGKRKKR